MCCSRRSGRSPLRCLPLTDPGDRVSRLAELVRAADHDRYLAALYAPAEKREALLSLYAFNAEIASIRERVSQPLPGEIRLQWWRDAILSGDVAAGAGNPVAEALIAAIESFRLPRHSFDDYLEARLFDLYDDPMPSRNDLEGYCGETASALIQLSSLVLDKEAASARAELAGHAGCAQAITGLLRLLPLHRARGQCYVPADILAASGVTVQEFNSATPPPAAAIAVAAMIALAREHLAAFERGTGRLPESLRPAYLPLAQTRAYIDRMSGREANMLTTPVEISAIRRHWTAFRHASRGWR